jgi:hypothetical protein
MISFMKVDHLLKEVIMGPAGYTSTIKDVAGVATNIYKS